MNRREFIAAGGTLAAAGVVGAVDDVVAKCGAGGVSCGRLIASPPVLQNGAETSMGVGFAVSAMANGYVIVSESPDM